jgi:hypothetical protein
MKRQIIALASLSLLILLTGCSDPLTALLKKNKYTPIVPISDGYCLGDIYSGSLADLTDEVYIDKDYPEIYSHIAGFIRPAKVCLPEVSGKETFELNANADIIGKVQGRLIASGAKRFRVNIEDPCTYSISSDTFRTKVYSELVKRDPNTNYIGMYVVASLLKVKRIEYELTDEKDVNITVSPQDAIKYVTNAELGMALDANNHYKLYTSTPSYIGFKLAKINASGGYGPPTRGPEGNLGANLSESMQAKKAKIKELSKEQAKVSESMLAKEAEMKKLIEVQTELSEAMMAKETKVEELYAAKATPSGSMAEEVKAEELRAAQAELSQLTLAAETKMGELRNAQAELSKSVLADETKIKELRSAQAELLQSILADEAKMEELQKVRAKLAESIVLEEVPMEELRKVGAKLNR